MLRSSSIFRCLSARSPQGLQLLLDHVRDATQKLSSVRRAAAPDTGIPLPRITQLLSDELLESASEFGGLKGVIEQHGKSHGLSIVRTLAGGRSTWSVVASNSGQATSFTVPHITLPPGAPTGRVPVLAKSRPREPKNLSVPVSLIPTPPTTTNFSTADPMLRWFPRFMIPMSVLLSSSNALDEAHRSSSSSAPRTLEQLFDATLASHRKLDIASSTNSPDEVLKLVDAAASGASNARHELAQAAENGTLFVRVAMPFWDDAWAATDAALGSHRVEDYDIYRLARFLKTTVHTTIGDLTTRDVHNVVSRPLVHVALAHPELFHFDEAAQSIKFIMPPQFAVPDLPMSLEETEEMVAEQREAHRQRRKGGVATVKVVRKDSVLPRHLKRWKNRDSVFHHPDVLVYYIFDSLPTDRAIFIDDLHALISEEARFGATIDVKLLQSRPHLFHCFSVNNDWRTAFQRADIPHPEVKEVSDEHLLAFTLEIAHSVWTSTLSKSGRSHGECDSTTIYSRLYAPARKYLKQTYGTMDNFLASHPKYFMVLEGKKCKAGVAGCSTVVADPLAQRVEN